MIFYLKKLQFMQMHVLFVDKYNNNFLFVA